MQWSSPCFPPFIFAITIDNYQHTTWVLLTPACSVLQTNNRPLSGKLLSSAVKHKSLSPPKNPEQAAEVLFLILFFPHSSWILLFLTRPFPFRYSFIHSHNSRPLLHSPWGRLIFHQLKEAAVMLLVSHMRGGRMSSLGVALAGRRSWSIQLCPGVQRKPEVANAFTFCPGKTNKQKVL